MESRQILKRGRLVYYISENSVIVGVGKSQYVSYNIYNSPSRSNLAEFKKRLIHSKPDEYGNVIDQIDLARKYNLIGAGTTKPTWGEE